MITKEIIEESLRLGTAEVNRDYVIGVNTTAGKVFITLATTSGERLHVQDVFETDLKTAMKDLPALVKDRSVSRVVVSIGPERVWADDLAKVLGCDVFLCGYTRDESQPLKDNFLKVNRAESFDRVFESFSQKKISVNPNFEDEFPSDWENQLMNVKRMYFEDHKYTTSGHDNFFHSLVYAMLAAKYKS